MKEMKMETSEVNTQIFLNNLIQNLHALCQVYIKFNTNIELIGHIYMKVDNAKEVYNYFINEAIAKTDHHGTLVSSGSFLAKKSEISKKVSTLWHSGSPALTLSLETPEPFAVKTARKQLQQHMLSPKLIPNPDSSSPNKSIQSQPDIQTQTVNLDPVQSPAQIHTVQAPNQVSVNSFQQSPAQNVVSFGDQTKILFPVSINQESVLPFNEVNSPLPLKIQNVTSLVNNESRVQETDSESNVTTSKPQEDKNSVLKSDASNQIAKSASVSSMNSLAKNYPSASDILKRIKKEPCDTPEGISSPSLSPSLKINIASPSQSSKQKRKTNHSMRLEFEEFVKTESNKTREKKKPRIIQSRTPPKKLQAADTDDNSQSSSGDFADVQVHFGEVTPCEDNEVFPVTLCQNLAGFEEACNQSVIPDFTLENITSSQSYSQSLKRQYGFVTKRGRYKSYSQMDKQTAVQSAEIYGVKATCQRYNIPASTLCTWRSILVAFLRQNEAIKSALSNADQKKRGTYNFYTIEQKKKAVELSVTFGIAAICQKFGIPSSTLWSWKKAFDKSQVEEKESDPSENSNSELKTYQEETENEVIEFDIKQELSHDNEETDLSKSTESSPTRKTSLRIKLKQEKKTL